MAGLLPLCVFVRPYAALCRCVCLCARVPMLASVCHHAPVCVCVWWFSLLLAHTEMVRQSLREPTMAAAAVLGFSFLLDEDTAYLARHPPGTGTPSTRSFLEYVLAGDGLCLELLQGRRRPRAGSATA
jgi:hypothetical protein